MATVAEELTQLKDLLDAGVITQAEFDAKKAQILNSTPTSVANTANTTAVSSEKNKVVAGVLAILLGTLGIHKFYLGYTKEGVIMLLVSLLTLGLGACIMAIIALVEGIMYLTKSDNEFYNTYVLGRRGWF